MARIKTVYGKRPKTNTTSANFSWSSPNKISAEKVEDVTSAIENLNIKEHAKPDNKSRKKHERALQTIDGNAATQPRRRRDKKEKAIDVELDKPVVLYHGPEEGGLKFLKTPRRREQKEKLRADETEFTPRRSERRRQAKDVSKIISERYTGADPQDERASSPRPGHPLNATPLSPARNPNHRIKSPSKPNRRSRSPSVMVPVKSPASNPMVSYTKPLLRLCSDSYGRSAPTPFSTWSTSLEQYFNIIKIAEASYGEVYRLSLKSPCPGFSASDESVLKIIALKPPSCSMPTRKGKKTKQQKQLEEKSENMSTVESVTSEVKLLQRMTYVPGFTNFRDVRIVQGAPSEPFVAAWKHWNKGRPKEKQSIFPDPGKKGSYDDEQLWAVIEMQDAGTDLENLKTDDIGGVFGVWDILWGVILALGKGEEEARFEHRDLHMGNICIRPSSSVTAVTAPSMPSQLNRNINFTGLETTIIDYTLSRAQMTHPAISPDPPESEIAYLDLESDKVIFEGDGAEEYQYEIYRMMRGAMYLDDPLADVEERWDEAEQSGRTWVGFHPQTNLVWIHFILHEMMQQVESTGKKKGNKRRGKISNDEDVGEFEELMFETKRKLERILKKVQKLLDPKKLSTSGLHSVKDLVALALEEEWLDERDVIAVPSDEGEDGSILEVIKKLDDTTIEKPKTKVRRKKAD